LTRQQKTPAQRAQEALDVEERRVKKLGAKVTKARAELDHLDKEWNAAINRRDHLKKHPDLILGVPDGDAAARRPRTTSTTGGTTR
jgi:hypothetical protein